MSSDQLLFLQENNLQLLFIFFHFKLHCIAFYILFLMFQNPIRNDST